MGWFKNIMFAVGWTWHARKEVWKEKADEQRKILKELKAKRLARK